MPNAYAHLDWNDLRCLLRGFVVEVMRKHARLISGQQEHGAHATAEVGQAYEQP